MKRKFCSGGYETFYYPDVGRLMYFFLFQLSRYFIPYSSLHRYYTLCTSLSSRNNQHRCGRSFAEVLRYNTGSITCVEELSHFPQKVWWYHSWGFQAKNKLILPNPLRSTHLCLRKVYVSSVKNVMVMIHYKLQGMFCGCGNVKFLPVWGINLLGHIPRKPRQHHCWDM